ncbi:unnamed protein product [Brassica oleracea var. botrytis]
MQKERGNINDLKKSSGRYMGNIEMSISCNFTEKREDTLISNQVAT